jgi:endonuclease VIII
VPEGNTIHWLARRHTKDLEGRTVRVTSPQGRFAREARRLDRRRFRKAEAWGKHLFHHWEGGHVVHIHLGMAGWFYRHRGGVPEPRATVRMRLAVPGLAIDLIGPPTCELISEEKRREVLARLGPDPLRPDADPAIAWENLRRRPRAIGDALLDQRILSGVGNIYRNEALFLAGIHPRRSTRRLTAAEWRTLWGTLQALMRRGAATGRTETVAPGEPIHPRAPRDPEDDFYVYRQERCRRCGTTLKEFPLSARRMFACPRCQPRFKR